jgi:hypothetical protein
MAFVRRYENECSFSTFCGAKCQMRRKRTTTQHLKVEFGDSATNQTSATAESRRGLPVEAGQSVGQFPALRRYCGSMFEMRT